MTILNDRPTTTTGPGDFGPSSVSSASKQSLGKAVVNWITSTDHKVIGYMYLVTSMVWFLIAGLMALAMRAELAIPGMQVVSLEQYNQLFTIHGTIMLFLFATPLFVGFGNVSHAPADRCTRRCLPAVKHAGLLALPLWWTDCCRGLFHPRRCGIIWLVCLCPVE